MRVLLPCALVVLIAGCGGEEPAAEASKPSATPTATASATPAPQTEIRALVDDWYATVAAKDPEAACELLIPSEQAHFERKFGSCGKAFEFSAKERKGVEGLRAGTITVDGKRAKIALVDAFEEPVSEPLYAVNERGEWGMARKVAYTKAASG